MKWLWRSKLLHFLAWHNLHGLCMGGWIHVYSNHVEISCLGDELMLSGFVKRWSFPLKKLNTLGFVMLNWMELHM